MRIFLDMDGVLADFMKSALELHGYPTLFDEPRSKGVWDTASLLGISAREFWKPIDSKEDFWSTISKTTEADELVALAEKEAGRENVCILTAPSKDAKCFLGKQVWIDRYYPQFSRRVIFATAKGFISGDDKILIDDKESNIADWEAGSGYGILVPRPWNHEHAHETAALGRIQDHLAYPRMESEA